MTTSSATTTEPNINVTQNIKSQPYWDPYLAGIALGLVLLASFLIAGRGIGASGAVSQTLAHSAALLDINNAYFSEYVSSTSWIETWIVIEVVGIFLGAFVSAKLAGRTKSEVVKGHAISNRKRLGSAIIGGVLMGLAARLARGCTSGQALTGGALLSAGSWVFMLCVFVGAYCTIIFVKRSWL